MRERKNEKCGVKDEVSDEAGPPESGMINARDDDLARCEFEKLGEGALAVRGDEAFRNEHDPGAGGLRRTRDGVVVADGAAPGVEDLQAVECFTMDCSRAAPDEVAVVIAEDADRGRV